MKKVICFLLVAVMLAGTLPTALADETDELGMLRQRWYDKLIPPDDAYDDPIVSTKVTNNANTAEERWNSMNKAPTKNLWEDLELGFETSGESLYYSFDRLRVMSLAYKQKTSKLYQNQSLKNDIISAMTFLYKTQYNENIKYEKNAAHNWYYWEIGAPKSFLDTLVVMYDELGTDLLGQYIAALKNFSPDPSKYSYNTAAATSSNLVWKCVGFAVAGAVAGDGDMIKTAANAIGPAYEYADQAGVDDGFYTDGSYIMHSYFPYAGGYGMTSFADGLAMIEFLDGTSYALPEQYKKTVLAWAEDTFMPIIYNGNLMDMTRGREITRANAVDRTRGMSALVTVFQLAKIANGETKNALLSELKYNVLKDEARKEAFLNYLPTAELKSAQDMLADDSIKPVRRGETAQVFGAMDRVVYTGSNGFAYGLSLYSDRIAAYESMTDDNPTGWYTGFGMGYLYNDNIDHYTTSYWPTVDPYSHAGTTVTDLERSKGYLGNPGYRSGQNWAGGTSLGGRNAAAGMILEDFKDKPTDNVMTAKKSWFFFDNKIIALGSDINGPQEGVSVKTTVDNRILSGTPAATVDGSKATLSPEGMRIGKSFHIADGAAQTGYFFPAGGNVSVKLEERENSWKGLSAKPYNPDTMYRNQYYTITAPHGVQPKGASYAYIIMPNVTADELKQYEENQTVQILENTAKASGVSSEELGIQAANFWTDQPHTTGNITSSGKASVMYRDFGDELVISVSDPTQKQDTLEIEIAAQAGELKTKDDRVTVIQTEPTVKLSVDVSRARGKALEASFALDGERRPEKVEDFQNKKEIEGDNVFLMLDSNKAVAGGSVTSIFPQNASVTARLIDGATMVPVKFFTDILGAGAKYDSQTRTITLAYEGNTAVVATGSRTAVVNGKQLDMGCAVTEINDRNYLPLRFLASMLCGKEVAFSDGVIAVGGGKYELEETVFQYYKQLLFQ